MGKLSLVFTVVILVAVLTLCGAAGWLFGLEERSAAFSILFLSLLLVIGNIVLIVRIGKSPLLMWGGTLAYLAVAVGTGIAFARYSYSTVPSLVAENVNVTVTIKNLAATEGHIDFHVQYRVLKGGDRDFRWGDPGPSIEDGSVKNLKVIDLQPGYQSEIRKEAGRLQPIVIFPEPLKKSQRFVFGLEFDADSPPTPEVYWVTPITEPTQYLAMTIIVPKGRPCISVSALSEDAVEIGEKQHDESPPLLSDNNSKVTWAKSNPQQGRAYKLICELGSQSQNR